MRGSIRTEAPDDLPRFHIGWQAADAFEVTDRVLGRRVRVYLPLSAEEFRAGHAKHRWYVCRAEGRSGSRPESEPFLSASDAVAAIADGSWEMTIGHADRRPIRLRRP